MPMEQVCSGVCSMMTPDEKADSLISQKQYDESPLTIIAELEAYLKDDSPLNNIPHALLASTLRQLKGSIVIPARHTKKITRGLWERRVNDISILLKLTKLKTKDAIKLIADKDSIKESTLDARYRDKKYKAIKDNIKNDNDIPDLDPPLAHNKIAEILKNKSFIPYPAKSTNVSKKK